MRKSTALMSQFKAETKSGESLQFELCKGGYFSDKEEFGLKVVGKTEQNGDPTPELPVPIQCVKAGTKISVCGENLFDENALDKTYWRKQEDGSWKVGNAGQINGQHLWDNTNGLDNICLSCEYSNILLYNGQLVASLCILVYYSDGTREIITTDYGEAETYKKLNFISTKKVIYFRFSYGWGLPARLKNVMIYSGNMIIPYKPYVSNEITTPCDLYEDDIWYPVSGKVERHSCYIEFDGSEKWYNYGNDYAKFTELTVPSYLTYSNKLPSLSNRYPFDKDIHDIIPGQRFQVSNASYRWYVFDSMTFDEWKQKLVDWASEGKPLNILYKRLVPITEQYDPQPIFAIEGTVNVLQTPTDLSADLSATMLCRR